MILLGLVVQVEALGLRRTDEAFFRGQFPAKLDTAELEDSIRRLKGALLQLGIFSEVELLPRAVDTQLVIVAEVREAFPLWVFPTLGYDDASGWTGGLELGLSNLGGRAHRVGAGFTVGGYSSLSARASRPPSRAEPWGYWAKAWTGKRRWVREDATQEGWRAEGSLLVGWPLSAGVWLGAEKFAFSQTWPGEPEFETAFLGLVLQERRADDPAYPRSGRGFELKAYQASAGFRGLSLKLWRAENLKFAAVWASLKMDAQSASAPYHWSFAVGGVGGLRSYPYPTQRVPSRAVGSVYLRRTFFSWSWPFPWSLDLAPFAEAGAWGLGEEATGWGWGVGLEAGVFSRLTGFGAAWVSVNREGKLLFGTRIGTGL